MDWSVGAVGGEQRLRVRISLLYLTRFRSVNGYRGGGGGGDDACHSHRPLTSHPNKTMPEPSDIPGFAGQATLLKGDTAAMIDVTFALLRQIDIPWGFIRHPG